MGVRVAPTRHAPSHRCDTTPGDTTWILRPGSTGGDSETRVLVSCERWLRERAVDGGAWGGPRALGHAPARGGAGHGTARPRAPLPSGAIAL